MESETRKPMSVSGVNVETCRPEEGGRQLYLGVRQVSESRDAGSLPWAFSAAVTAQAEGRQQGEG